MRSRKTKLRTPNTPWSSVIWIRRYSKLVNFFNISRPIYDTLSRIARENRLTWIVYRLIWSERWSQIDFVGWNRWHSPQSDSWTTKCWWVGPNCTFCPLISCSYGNPELCHISALRLSCWTQARVPNMWWSTVVWVSLYWKIVTLPTFWSPIFATLSRIAPGYWPLRSPSCYEWMETRFQIDLVGQSRGTNEYSNTWSTKCSQVEPDCIFCRVISCSYDYHQS